MTPLARLTDRNTISIIADYALLFVAGLLLRLIDSRIAVGAVYAIVFGGVALSFPLLLEMCFKLSDGNRIWVRLVAGKFSVLAIIFAFSIQLLRYNQYL
jgi:hypothetical protein